MDLKGKDILVLDLETQKTFKEVGGRSSLHKLKISVTCTYDYLNDQYASYEESKTSELEKRLQNVGLLVGFNIKGFDLPVLQPYLFQPIDRIPCLDLIDVIQKERGHRASLDSVAAPTLKQKKSGHGLEAITMFAEGRMDDLIKYCKDDVRITKDIYEYGCREGKILFTSSWDYKTYEIPVDWKKETEELLSSASSESDSFPTSLF
jgi:DEAD/DEAH box helicase domain-containing protein